MRKDAKLNERQLIMIKDYFTKSLAGATMEEVAKDHGIARKTLSGYVNTDHGKQIRAEFQKELSIESLPTFYRVLDEKVAKGNKDAMQLYARIHGLLSPDKTEVTTTVNQSKDHAKEGYTAEEIAELERLLDEPTIKRVK
ncbi:hypothetical protein GLV94_01960 [Virgibacillus halodenitrificans]|uniref:phBC6A51 family helix-turn-helix protein n=1 Tax=Virgibacillus halodenitrificans TaxID=1482 RepID=UPI00136E7BA7|nr:phBC6A51 family helix-turn-helix protein [Virgibacillus halodenitrificans]MYL44399.1 hypothetical protein [Virgibacillus halodenitrificans]